MACLCLQHDVSALNEKRSRARAPASGKLLAESQPVRGVGEREQCKASESVARCSTVIQKHKVIMT